jgi:SNF2 family DNA or RNA helicase
MRRDVDELRKTPFHYVVLDEAQAIKNPGSQVAKAARLLRAEHNLALTGTPVENHMGDLWSIFEFLNPGMLGSSTHFSQIIKSAVQESRGGRGNGHAPAGRDAAVAVDAEAPAEEDAAVLGPRTLQSTEVAAQLGRALRPFVLRRTKKQVLADLPEKTEQTILCEMEPAQRQVYDQLLRHYRGTLLAQATPSGMSGGSSMLVLEALLRLRQAACHPGLIDPQRVGEPSAKLEALLEDVTELIEEGHKALVFSQFTSFLSIVRQRLDAAGIVYEYLDGQTRHRKQRVQRFQNDPDCPLFLISLKAGGLGLNLTAAEYVFILDPWWNPAVENQAIDRAHRIGQTRHVFAYRMICQDTVEQRIAELQERKRQLADAILGEQPESLLQSLTREDLERLLS